MRRAPVHVAVAAVIALLAGLVGVVVTASTASATYPGRDGRIAFVRHGQIYTVRPDGSGLRQLTTSGTNSHPKWGPQGHRIAFVHETADGATDVWVMGARGLRKKQVTHVGNATEPTWSPDGQSLAFGGGDLSALEKVSSKAPFGSPTDLLAYETGKCCGDELPEDAHPLNVDRFVAWSPDGTRIAVYNHDDDHLDDAIYMYNLAPARPRSTHPSGDRAAARPTGSTSSGGPRATSGTPRRTTPRRPCPRRSSTRGTPGSRVTPRPHRTRRARSWP